ncbi:MAG TPA: methyltransferase domain-containing protein [Sphingomonadaceae bacterium]|nr:methyltransferase domain-containing protein [Sphingomonadaceae bacterium]
MTSRQQANATRIYPEIGAGGFSHVDGTVSFYTRVNALLEPEFTVLDLGAGRGATLDTNPKSYRTRLAKLQGKVAKVVGVDVDPVVLENPYVDDAKIIKIGEPYPFPDNTFDMIVSDWVLEHVDNPQEFAAEVARVLKPGGWFCARTPNRWGMVGLVTSLIPNNAHAGLLSKLQEGRASKDVFPTRYLLNTPGRLKRAFPADRWDNYSYLSNPEPPYIQRSLLAMRAVLFAWRLAPPGFKTVFNVFLKLK